MSVIDNSRQLTFDNAYISSLFREFDSYSAGYLDSQYNKAWSNWADLGVKALDVAEASVSIPEQSGESNSNSVLTCARISAVCFARAIKCLESWQPDSIDDLATATDKPAILSSMVHYRVRALTCVERSNDEQKHHESGDIKKSTVKAPAYSYVPRKAAIGFSSRRSTKAFHAANTLSAFVQGEESNRSYQYSQSTPLAQHDYSHHSYQQQRIQNLLERRLQELRGR